MFKKFIENLQHFIQIFDEGELLKASGFYASFSLLVTVFANIMLKLGGVLSSWSIALIPLWLPIVAIIAIMILFSILEG